jgi:hypothetical protein
MRHILILAGGLATLGVVVAGRAFQHATHAKKLGALVAVVAVFIVLDLLLIARAAAKKRKAAPVRHAYPFAAGRK